MRVYLSWTLDKHRHILFIYSFIHIYCYSFYPFSAVLVLSWCHKNKGFLTTKVRCSLFFDWSWSSQRLDRCVYVCVCVWVGGDGWARERNVVLAFACRTHNYKLYVVPILPSCTKDRYKRRTGEDTSVKIHFLVEVIIPFYKKQTFCIG